VLGKRSITPDTAVRLAAALGTSERFLLGPQADFALEEAHRAMGIWCARSSGLLREGPLTALANLSLSTV
jgi:plasmid maintenance system antidote protein VapI